MSRKPRLLNFQRPPAIANLIKAYNLLRRCGGLFFGQKKKPEKTLADLFVLCLLFAFTDRKRDLESLVDLVGKVNNCNGA